MTRVETTRPGARIGMSTAPKRRLGWAAERCALIPNTPVLSLLHQALKGYDAPLHVVDHPRLYVMSV